MADKTAKPTSDGVMSSEPEDPSAAGTLMYNSLEGNLSLVAQIAEPAGISADRSLVVGERVWRVHASSIARWSARSGKCRLWAPVMVTFGALRINPGK